MARLTIRRSDRPRRALTAAVQRIDEPSKNFKSSSLGGVGGGWQKQAWEYHRRVGELRYYTSWRAMSASRCRLVGSDIDPITGRPTGATENLRVQQIVADIAGGAAGQSQMIKRLTRLLTVPGEGYVAMLVRTAEDTGVETEEWFPISRGEIKTSGQELEIILPTGDKHLFDDDRDILFRVWEPDAESAKDSDSAVHGAFDALNEIVRATASIDAASKSRLLGNGIVFLPQEMSLPRAVTPIAAPADPTAVIAPDPNQVEWRPASSQDMQDLLAQVAAAAIDDPSSTAANIPVFAQVPGESTKNVMHLKFDTPVAETALKTREAAMRRLALSLDVSPERLLGLGENSNHWSAWAIGDDDVSIHIAPILETISDAINRELLRGMLIDEGIDPDAYTVWYDTSSLTQDPDRHAEAAAAWDRGGISTAAYLSYLGFEATDGYDFSQVAGWKQWAADRIAQTPELLSTLAPLIDALSGVAVGPAPATPIEPTPPPEDGDNPESEPGTETDIVDADPADEPEELPASAYAFTRVCVNRALEMAAKRRKTRDRDLQALYSVTPIYRVHEKMAAVPFDDTDDMISGWDAAIDDQSLTDQGFDPATFRTMVAATARAALTYSRPMSFSHGQIEAAWTGARVSRR